MRRRIAVLAWVACACAAMGAAAPSADPEEDAELARLMAILDEETEIATKTRMNSDFVPGLVTVLHGDELEALGVETVWEALRLVPGIEPVMDELGMPSLVVRGIDFPFNSGNVKTLVDSAPLTRESAGINGAVLFWPIQQVERIEVIRGPGSVIYGDFAFMGLVNIVTRKQGYRVHVRGDSPELWSASARAGAAPDDAVQWSVGLAGTTTDDTPLPRPRVGEQDRVFGQGHLGYQGLSVSAHFLDVTLDDRSPAMGPPMGRPPRHFSHRSWALETGYERQLGDDVRASLRVSRLDDELSSPGSDFDDSLTRLGVDLHWSGWQRHAWLASIEYSALDITRAEHTGPSRPNEPPRRFEIRDEGRNVFSVTLQDRFDVTEAFGVTGGVRLDDYDDVGTRVTPRLSLAWRVSDHHIVKAQYAQGFRPPTFFEQYGGGVRNPDLDFETNSTTELNYIFRRPEMTGRVTLFYTDVDDMIFPIGGTPSFSNTRKGRARGVEAEWSQQFTSRLKGLANVTWVDSEHNRGQTTRTRDVDAAADWMGELALMARLSERALAAAHWTHVGRRGVADADAYDLLDVTLTLQDVLVPGVELRGGVKNLFDDRVGYVAENPAGASVLDYGDRAFWAQVAWGH